MLRRLCARAPSGITQQGDPGCLQGPSQSPLLTDHHTLAIQAESPRDKTPYRSAGPPAGIRPCFPTALRLHAASVLLGVGFLPLHQKVEEPRAASASASSDTGSSVAALSFIPSHLLWWCFHRRSACPVVSQRSHKDTTAWVRRLLFRRFSCPRQRQVGRLLAPGFVNRGHTPHIPVCSGMPTL